MAILKIDLASNCANGPYSCPILLWLESCANDHQGLTNLFPINFFTFSLFLYLSLYFFHFLSLRYIIFKFSTLIIPSVIKVCYLSLTLFPSSFVDRNFTFSCRSKMVIKLFETIKSNNFLINTFRQFSSKGLSSNQSAVQVNKLDSKSIYEYLSE